MTTPIVDDVTWTTTIQGSQSPFGDDTKFNDQFLLAEDLALKNTLINSVTIVDGNNKQQSMGAYFSMPDAELQKQTYPFATIDLIDIVENRAQVMSTYGPITNDSYLLQGYDITDQNYGIDGPMYGLSPMLLTYQVTSFARQPRHDRKILSVLNTVIFHPRFAQINVNSNLRRLIVLGFSKRDTTTDGKRLFRNVWTIQIPSEIFYDEVTLTQRAASVSINTTGPAVGVVGFLYPGIN